jgi:transposase
MAQLYMAYELGEREWKLGFTTNFIRKPRLRKIKARDRVHLKQEIRLAKEYFHLAKDTPVISCYEAGRDGFWLHRYLTSIGITNLVVDSSSIEVNRRKKRNKTDKLDAKKLLSMLIRYVIGDPNVWHVVNVPSEEVEDGRQLHRELCALQTERTRHVNRIKGLLAAQGITLSVTKTFLNELDDVRLWNGTPIRPGLRQRLEREYLRILMVETHMKQIEEEREILLQTSQAPEIEQIRNLMRLKGIGINTAWITVMEFFRWRNFRNRRQVGALAGLVPTRHQSGDTDYEQGIGKAGNRFVRGIIIEIAWGWVRFQPDSKLTRWFQNNYGKGTKSQRRIGIVAVARRLLIDLWKYLEIGEVPEGAVFNTSH